MAHSNSNLKTPLIGAKRLTNALVFVVGCVLINFAGSQLVAALSLPIYLDCVGTMIAAIFGGYVPGVLVGYFTNLVNSLSDPSSTFYAVINVLIAISATFFAQRGWFKSPPKAIATVFAFALLGGGLASVLTWCLYGFDFGQGVTAPLVHLIHTSTPLPPMAAQLAGDFLLDVVDKALTVAIVIFLYHVLSHTFVAKIDLSPWQQSPLSSAQREEIGSSKSRVASVKTKFTLILSIIMVVLVVATTYLSYATFYGAFCTMCGSSGRPPGELHA